MYANLVVSMAQVDGDEDCCLTQPIEQVSNTRYGEHIEPGLAVQATIINTHAQFTSLFTYEQHRCAIR